MTKRRIKNSDRSGGELTLGAGRKSGAARRGSAARPRRHITPGGASFWSRARPIAAFMAGLWFLSVLLFRFAPPPLTSIVCVRQVQSWFFSDVVGLREWRWIDIAALPNHVVQAVVTAEDARFVDHLGVDLLAVGDVLDSAGGKRRLRGASTITMQTVKNIYLWPGRSYLRKVFEWLMAPIAGIVWGKRRTLALYVNVIEWGEGIYGIESAARHYFNKSASKLSLHEAAALAAILPNPRKLSPLKMVQSTRRRYARIMRESSATRVPSAGYER